LGSATDIGNVRERNEDRILAEIIPYGAKAVPTALLLVADGLGGHEGGEMASTLARDTLREVITEPVASGSVSRAAISRLLAQALKLANDRIFAAGAETLGLGRPGTTMTACLLSHNRYDIAHVGDSRAYLITPQGALQLTDDDSVVAEAVRQGLITGEQARSSPYRNQLTRSIGTNEQVDPSIYHAPIDCGDMIVLCSDGLSEYVRPEEIHLGALGNPSLQNMCNQFVQLAKQRGGLDNISIVAARAGSWDQRTDEVRQARDRTTRAKKQDTVALVRRFAAAIAGQLL
jgi:protein phosphatase